MDFQKLEHPEMYVLQFLVLLGFDPILVMPEYPKNDGEVKSEIEMSSDVRCISRGSS